MKEDDVLKYEMNILSFPGFYDSYLSLGENDLFNENLLFSAGLDEEVLAGYKHLENGLERDERDIIASDIFLDAFDSRRFYADLTSFWVDRYLDCVEEIFPGLIVARGDKASLWSPKSYNYCTDQASIEVSISRKKLEELIEKAFSEQELPDSLTFKNYLSSKETIFYHPFFDKYMEKAAWNDIDELRAEQVDLLLDYSVQADFLKVGMSLEVRMSEEAYEFITDGSIYSDYLDFEKVSEIKKRLDDDELAFEKQKATKKGMRL